MSDENRFQAILHAWKDKVVDVESGMNEEDKHWSKSLILDLWWTNQTLDEAQAKHAADLHRHTGIDSDS